MRLLNNFVISISPFLFFIAQPAIAQTDNFNDIQICKRVTQNGATVESCQPFPLDEKNADSYNTLGNLLMEVNQIDRAIAVFRKAIQIDPNNPSSYNNLATAFSEQKSYDEAVKNLRQAIKINPGYTMAYYNLGLTLSLQNKLDEANKAFRQVIKLPDEQGTAGSSHAMAHNNLGYNLQRQGKFSEAIAQYQKSLSIDPNNTNVQSNLRDAQKLLQESR
jgi:superkiller protein 3